MSISCVFSRAWQKLKTEVDEGKTSWGKNELKTKMFECLHDAALQADEEAHLQRDD